MQCDEFEDRLNTLLDERQRPQWDPEVSLHCDACARCRRLAAVYDALLEGFYELATPDAPTDMGLRVVAELRPRSSTTRRVALGTAMLATAAALLVVVGARLRGTPDAPRADSHQNLASATTHDAPPKLDRLPIVPQLLGIAESPDADPYAGLAKETGQGLANVILYVPGVGGAKGFIDVQADDAASEPAWAVQMSEGLRPITSSVTATLNLLLQSFPVSQLAARG